jgi:hypothetical protein
VISDYAQLALEWFGWSVMAFAVWHVRRRAQAEVMDAYRDQRAAWLQCRVLWLRNLRLSEDNKMLRHRLEGRL